MKKGKNKRKGYSYCIMLLTVLSMTVGCATARKAILVGRTAVDAVVSVKDPVFDAADKLVDAAEGVKNTVVEGSKATTSAVTQ